jgi:predicted ArsR family transcriptional regulator
LYPFFVTDRYLSYNAGRNNIAGWQMLNLTDKQIIEYFKKSYTSVDGLWFMKAEENYDFEAALQMDVKVWEIMPKIQARMLKPLANTGNDLKDLMECLTTKLALEEFSFTTEDNTDSGRFSIIINNCPWHNLMVKSKREELSAKVGSRICNSEYEVWAKEFGKDIAFIIDGQICAGAEHCILRFNY